MILLLGFAFLSGLVTILAPCIWPLLPIILSSSIGGKTSARPAGITLGIMMSFTFFTLTLSFLVRLFGIDPSRLRTFAIVIIAFLGLCLVIPKLSQLLEERLSRVGNKIRVKTVAGHDFGTGLLTGLSLGILWAPCAGPILAAIAALAITGRVTFSVFLLTIAYVTGVGLPLFLFGYGGQRLLQHTRKLAAYTGKIQQGFGVLMILTAFAIYQNYDKTLQLKLANRFPTLTPSFTQLEETKAVQEQLTQLIGEGAKEPYLDPSLYNERTPAPELSGITRWLNTDHPLSLQELRGKVVLVDFWTYTCINCLRTLPHVTHWYNTYKDEGFVVIGVHTPEFEFEKKTENVQEAIKRAGIQYPVAQDNAFGTWTAYQNRYWPAEYLIDARGSIRRTHFGEGSYDEMEEAIKGLLKETGANLSEKTEPMSDQTPRGYQSPETYLGAERTEYFYPDRRLSSGKQTYTLAPALPLDRFTLGGTWTIEPEKAVATAGARLAYHFRAGNVFLVLRPNQAQKGMARLLLDGKPLTEESAGKDVQDGRISITEDRLYHLIDLHGKKEEHTLTIEFLDGGIEAFAFTFG